ncbi:MAG: hypothetical protein V7606_593 [Burkholderiales bacterium]
MPKIAVVANKVTPYRTPVFERLARMPEVSLQVIFCCEREPNRLWDLTELNFNHTVLRQRFTTVKQRYIHNNPDVFVALGRFSPHVVVTTGFNPTHLYAFAYAWMKRATHVPFTDGTDKSEKTLSGVHKAIRRFVFARSAAFVGASAGSRRLYESYGIPGDHCFQSCLAIDNDAYAPVPQQEERQFDFLFCGRIEPVKNPLFALNVARETAVKLGRRVSIQFVGDGSQREDVARAAMLQPHLVEATFQGFAHQSELPSLYHSARLFLFPTLWDPWGVVVNEACAAGLPVIASPDAGVSGELVRDRENGFVCDLDVERWASRASSLLSDEASWQSQSERSLALVREYSYDAAAKGLLAACQYAVSTGTRGRVVTADNVRTAP